MLLYPCRSVSNSGNSVSNLASNSGSSLVPMKDWNKEGLKVSKAMRFFLPKSPRDRTSFWPGAFIGEGSPNTRAFSMRKPFPENPFPLTFDRPNEDSYYSYMASEARVSGIAMHLLLKDR